MRLIGAASLRNPSGTAVAQQPYSDIIACDTARDTVSPTHAAQDADSRPAPRVKVIFVPRSTPSADAASAGSAPTRP